ncbi:Elongation factor 1-beta [Penicillium citrinum]|uniref:Elongation factor 1-beta n=1 Tax=Penicillium citrinum TaxID=5077 RepID=A0A9W9NDB0_PENCI|nr:Elongation factor 1-beta [Penicillium citrinum]KAJ5217786.1 Elongation factor 1-beta [Penicillium citrinum]
MGFTDFVSDAGLSLANNYLATRSYIVGHAPSQADVVTYKAFTASPDAEKYPHVARWLSLPTAPRALRPLPTPRTSPPRKRREEDLFASDSEDEDPAVVAERNKNLEEYKKKKAAKGPKPAAKSLVTLEVKPWDDETNLEELEANVRAIEMDGLVWGASKFVAVGFGIKKLQINLVVEDEKVSTDELQAQIEEDEDHVQSTDVAAMQKL